MSETQKIFDNPSDFGDELTMNRANRLADLARLVVQIAEAGGEELAVVLLITKDGVVMPAYHAGVPNVGELLHSIAADIDDPDHYASSDMSIPRVTPQLVDDSKE